MYNNTQKSGKQDLFIFLIGERYEDYYISKKKIKKMNMPKFFFFANFTSKQFCLLFIIENTTVFDFIVVLKSFVFCWIPELKISRF